MFKKVLIALCIVTLSSASLSGKVSTLSSAASRANERSLESKDDIALSEQREGWGEDFGGHSRADRSCIVLGCRKLPEYRTLCNSLIGFIMQRFDPFFGNGLSMGGSRSRIEFWMEQCTEYFSEGDFDRYVIPDWMINQYSL